MIKILGLVMIMVIGICMRHYWIVGSIKPLSILSTSAEGQALMYYGFPENIIVKMKSNNHALYKRGVMTTTNLDEVYWNNYYFNRYITPDEVQIDSSVITYEELLNRRFKTAPTEHNNCPAQLLFEFIKEGAKAV